MAVKWLVIENILVDFVRFAALRGKVCNVLKSHGVFVCVCVCVLCAVRRALCIAYLLYVTHCMLHGSLFVHVRVYRICALCNQAWTLAALCCTPNLCQLCHLWHSTKQARIECGILPPEFWGIGMWPGNTLDLKHRLRISSWSWRQGSVCKARYLPGILSSDRRRTGPTLARWRDLTFALLGVFEHPLRFLRITIKRRHAVPPGFHLPYSPFLPQLCESFNPWLCKVRLPGQVKWPTIQNLQSYYSYNVWGFC